MYESCECFSVVVVAVVQWCVDKAQVMLLVLKGEMDKNVNCTGC